MQAVTFKEIFESHIMTQAFQRYFGIYVMIKFSKSKYTEYFTGPI